MTWGVVSIGGIEFREETTASQDGDSLTITGQVAHPPRSRAVVRNAHASLSAMGGLVVPVTFTDKAELTGFYGVDSARSDYEKWANGAVETATWQAQLVRLGSARDVEIESRVPLIGRQTDHAATPVFWHAPAGGARSYYTGSSVPLKLGRLGSEGTIPVYLGLPSVAPRWVISADEYLNGAARLNFAGLRTLGVFTPPLVTWEMSNSLVRVTQGTNGFIVSTWTGSKWSSPTEYVIYVASEFVTGQPEVTILRNDPEEVAIRLTYDTSDGRLTLDLSLRRGSRFVTGLLKRHGAAFLAVVKNGLNPGDGSYDTATVGVVRASANDADGNRWVTGSAKSFAVTHAVSRNAATRLDFFAGHEVGGSAAVPGDTAADLLAQYLGSVQRERVRIVKR